MQDSEVDFRTCNTPYVPIKFVGGCLRGLDDFDVVLLITYLESVEENNEKAFLNYSPGRTYYFTSKLDDLFACRSASVSVSSCYSGPYPL